MNTDADRKNVIKGLECCILRDPDDSRRCAECPKSEYGRTISNSCINGLMVAALALLKEQDKDAEIIRKCRDGKVLKHIGNGVVVLNFDWWKKVIESEGFKIVPSVEDLLKAQEPVKPVFERIFMSDIEIYDCGKCGTSLGAKGIAKYCMKCGRKVKWE